MNFFSFFNYLNREVFTQDASYLPDTMILVMTVLFYIVTIFSRIYGLAATVFNLVIMLCAIIALVLQQWNNLGIAVAILVISYLLMGAWDIVAAFFASAKEFFTGVLFA